MWPNLPGTVFTDLGIDRDQLAALSHALVGEIVLRLIRKKDGDSSQPDTAPVG